MDTSATAVVKVSPGISTISDATNTERTFSGTILDAKNDAASIATNAATASNDGAKLGRRSATSASKPMNNPIAATAITSTQVAWIKAATLPPAIPKLSP